MKLSTVLKRGVWLALVTVMLTTPVAMAIGRKTNCQRFCFTELRSCVDTADHLFAQRMLVAP
jgi:hypothetical protein